jgi:hypothetical protein
VVSIAGTKIIAKIRNLIQAIWIEGNVSDRYFAIASELPKNTVEVMISAIPRNGRSARAGAERRSVLASGTVSLVNLKAGSWGLENGPPRIESRIEYATDQTTIC